MKKLSIISLCICLLSACTLNLPDPIADMGDENIKKGTFIKYDKYSVYSDNNGDSIVNKGETVRLWVWLKNTGTSTAKGVKATFATTSTYASSFTPTTQLNYGDISAGSSKVAYYGYYYHTIQFTVSSSAPAGTQIPINISITDESGNTWTESFTITVEATKAQIVYDKYSVYSDNNSDGVINKGETVGLWVWLKNTGTSTAKGVKATFATTSMYASSFTPTTQLTYGDISAGSSEVAYYGYYYHTIQFAVSSSAPAGTQIPISISITDESSNTWTSSFDAVVGSENAEIAYEKYTVVADYDGDGKVEKGETVYLQVFLKNIGSGTASRVKAAFSTSSAYVSNFLPATQVDYGNFSGGVSKYGQGGYDFSVYYTIKFTVSSSTPANTQIPISISLADGGGNTWTQSFNVAVQ